MKKSKRVPKFKSETAEARYWDTHSLADHLDEFKPAKNVRVKRRSK